MMDSTQRFSNRVENYTKYRPSYPKEMLSLLAGECGLTPAAIIADVGSGTGIMTRIFLENGNQVFAVEPNSEMRRAAEQILAVYPHFISVTASAEATTLPAGTADFVVAAQAFHWFDRDQARLEFVRILKPDGWVVLVWNERRAASTPLQSEYEQLLRKYSTDYANVDHRNITGEILHAFFLPDEFKLQTLSYSQTLNFEELKGRLLSSSYSPLPGEPNCESMLEDLRAIFDAHQIHGQVAFEYDTQLFYGHLHPRV
jgi:ubiquinone/menaquinone biosynthesis C-methylase UbiE